MTFFIRFSLLLRFLVFFKKFFILNNKDKLVYINTNNKNNRKSIPVLIHDRKIDKFSKHSSINEAAKYLNTYPNTIWRKIQTNELFLHRYRIMVMSKHYYFIICYSNLKKFILNIINNIINIIKNNRIFIIKVILMIILLTIICFIFFNFLIILISIIEKLNDLNVHTRSFQLGYMFQHKTRLELSNVNILKIDDKINKFISTDKNLENKIILFYGNIFWKSSILHSILISLIDLDFHSVAPSPIIDNITNQQLTNNSLDVQNLRINTNLSEIIMNNRILENRSKPKELLNYQSNILYLLINGISPSLY